MFKRAVFGCLVVFTGPVLGERSQISQKKQLSSLGKLLPWTSPTRNAATGGQGPQRSPIGGSATTIDAFGGCFQWSSSRSDIVELGFVDSEGNAKSWEAPRSGELTGSGGDGCIQRVALYAAQNLELVGDQYERANVTAHDIVSGSKLHAEVHIARIDKIELETSMRSINVGATETLQVKAYDAHGNVFSSLEGVRFHWSNGDQKILRSLALGSNAYRSSAIRRALQEQNEQADVHLVQGISAGVTTVTVTLQEPGYPHISTTVEVKVKEPIEIMPTRTIAAPGSTFAVDLLKQGSNGLSVKVKLPSSNYSWTSSHPEFFDVSSGGRVCVTSEFKERVDGRISAIDSRGTSDGIASVVVTEPARMSLNLIKVPENGEELGSGTLYLVEGESYILEPKAFDDKNLPMLIPSNSKFDYDCLSTSAKITNGNQRKCGLIEEARTKSELSYQNIVEQGSRIVRAINLGENDIFLNWTGNEADTSLCHTGESHTFPKPLRGTARVHVVPRLSLKGFTSEIDPLTKYNKVTKPLILPGGQSYGLEVEGGSGYVAWESSDEMLASVSTDGLIKTRQPPSDRPKTLTITARDQYNPSNHIMITILMGKLSNLNITVPHEELRLNDPIRVAVEGRIEISDEELQALEFPDSIKRGANFLRFDACHNLDETNLIAYHSRIPSSLKVAIEGVEGERKTVLDKDVILKELYECSVFTFTPTSIGDGKIYAALDQKSSSSISNVNPEAWPIHPSGVVGTFPFSVVDKVRPKFPQKFLQERLANQRPKPRCDLSSSWPSCIFSPSTGLHSVERVVGIGQSIEIYFEGGPRNKPAMKSQLEVKNLTVPGAVQIDPLKTSTSFPDAKNDRRLFKVTCLKEVPSVNLEFSISYEDKDGKSSTSDKAEAYIACSKPYRMEINGLPFHADSNTDIESHPGIVTPTTTMNDLVNGDLLVSCGMEHELAVFAWDIYGREIDILSSPKTLKWTTDRNSQVMKNEQTDSSKDRIIKYSGARTDCSSDTSSLIKVDLGSSKGAFGFGGSSDTLSDAIMLYHVPDVDLVTFEPGLLKKLFYSTGAAFRLRTVFGSGRAILRSDIGDSGIKTTASTLISLASSTRSSRLSRDELLPIRPDVDHVFTSERSPMERSILSGLSVIIPTADDPSNGHSIKDISNMSGSDSFKSIIKQVLSSNEPSLSSMEWLLKPNKGGTDRLLLFDPYVNGHKKMKVHLTYSMINAFMINWLDLSTGKALYHWNPNIHNYVGHVEIDKPHEVTVSLIDEAGKTIPSELTQKLDIGLQASRTGGLANYDKDDFEAIVIHRHEVVEDSAVKVFWTVRSPSVVACSLHATLKDNISGSNDRISIPVDVQFYEPLSLIPSAINMPPNREIEVIAIGGPAHALWETNNIDSYVVESTPVKRGDSLNILGDLGSKYGNASLVTSLKSVNPGSIALEVRLNSTPQQDSSTPSVHHFISGSFEPVKLNITVAEPIQLTLDSPQLSSSSERLDVQPYKPTIVSALVGSSAGVFTPGVVSADEFDDGIPFNCSFSWFLSGKGSNHFAIVSPDMYSNDDLWISNHDWLLKGKETSTELKCNSCNRVAVVYLPQKDTSERDRLSYHGDSAELTATIRCTKSGWSANSLATYSKNVKLSMKKSTAPNPIVYGGSGRLKYDSAVKEGIILLSNQNYSIPIGQSRGVCNRPALRLWTYHPDEDVTGDLDVCIPETYLDDNCVLQLRTSSRIGCQSIVHIVDTSGSVSTIPLSVVSPSTIKIWPNQNHCVIPFGKTTDVPISIYDDKGREILIPQSFPFLTFPHNSKLFRGKDWLPQVYVDDAGHAVIRIHAADVSLFRLNSADDEDVSICSTLTVSAPRKGYRASLKDALYPWSSDHFSDTSLSKNMLKSGAIWDSLQFCFVRGQSTWEGVSKLNEVDSRYIAKELNLIPKDKVYENLLFTLVIAIIAGLLVYGLISTTVYLTRSSPSHYPNVVDQELFCDENSGRRTPKNWTEQVILPNAVRTPIVGRTPLSNTPTMNIMSTGIGAGGGVNAGTGSGGGGVIGGLNDPYDSLRQK